MPESQGFAVVTGAAGGIGQATVRGFHAAGYAVIATDLVPAPADLPCRVYLEVDLARTVADTAYSADVFGRIRVLLAGQGLAVLVNNAATQVLGGAETLGRDDWRHTLNVNLLAPFFWTQALLPALEQARGSIINISSIHARLTKPGFVAYSTSKAALSGLTRALALDLGGRVRINAIEPAAVATDMLKAGFIGRPKRFRKLKSCHPVGRIGTPEEVAACALWLASDNAAFVHGSCIALDGGIGAVLYDPS
ncbi:MAG: SDR family oxidoreductase [Rhodobacteraceae bacterium]|nr:SDR family oxidoreductase [Paracoccaceae bacterium]